jgi:hypothetical protein
MLWKEMECSAGMYGCGAGTTTKTSAMLDEINEVNSTNNTFSQDQALDTCDGEGQQVTQIILI